VSKQGLVYVASENNVSKLDLSQEVDGTLCPEAIFEASDEINQVSNNVNAVEYTKT
jgi:hypothetical protein